MREPKKFSTPTLSVIQHNTYPYTHDLCQLESQTPPSSPLPDIPNFSKVHSPLKAEPWAKALEKHPDQEFRAYLLNGIRNGFSIGFDHSSPLQPAQNNMSSAYQHTEVVQEYLTKECQENRVLGPLPRSKTEGIHISRFGVIPKKHQSNKWRLILDLSFPQSTSVNDGIDPARCSLSYASIDDAAHIIAQMGPNTLLAKIDIAKAYRNISVNPRDRILLGMSWNNNIFVDTALPFGLRSAPKIFCAISDTLEWILWCKGVSSCLHYIDDFITFGQAETTECKNNLDTIIKCCDELGLPLATEKVEGPTKVLTFLGIEIDTGHMVLRLPRDKLVRLQQLIASWISRKAATKRDLLSLIGELSHATKVVLPGRAFLRQLIDLAASRSSLDHWVRLDTSFRSDLIWWHLFISDWNGTSLLLSHVLRPPEVTITSDASGSWGCGAFCEDQWFQRKWTPNWAGINIACKEFVPIVVGLELWGLQCRGKHIRVQSDNMAVVSVINLRKGKDPLMAHLLRCLQFISAKYDLYISAEHIQGSLNSAADALSRNNLDAFFSSLPQAQAQPRSIPAELWDWAMSMTPNWLSLDWRDKLKSFYTTE